MLKFYILECFLLIIGLIYLWEAIKMKDDISKQLLLIFFNIYIVGVWVIIAISWIPNFK